MFRVSPIHDLPLFVRGSLYLYLVREVNEFVPFAVPPFEGAELRANRGVQW